MAKRKNTHEKVEVCCVHGESEEATVQEPLMPYDWIFVKCLESGLMRGCSLVAGSDEENEHQWKHISALCSYITHYIPPNTPKRTNWDSRSCDGKTTKVTLRQSPLRSCQYLVLCCNYLVIVCIKYEVFSTVYSTIDGPITTVTTGSRISQSADTDLEDLLMQANGLFPACFCFKYWL